MKAKEAKLNTHYTHTTGFVGKAGSFKMYKKPLEIYCTVDDDGDTISVNDGHTMFLMRVDVITRLINETREDYIRKNKN